ncbi:MAG: FKBP-type peptidyl-prolyl cis-trans isomerase [Planctomycetes bacterium]|nr:FKBP-type peptidyl-prolyl cis-trans isomerase [Planctomycetota bacterium]
MKRLLLVLALAQLSSCAFLGFTRPVDVDHVRVATQHGVVYEDLLPGQGPEVAEGERVRVDYVGYLDDGTQFDSSLDRGVPIEFVHGQAPIAGWDEGMAGMRAGGRRRMELPPELAYGEAGVPGIVPENARLTFELELLAILADED